MGQLVVVRHGQASLSKAFSGSGSGSSPSTGYDELSEPGCAQAQALGAYLATYGPELDVVYSGPARRQRDTAALAGEVVRGQGGTWPESTLLPELDEHDAFGMLRAAVSEIGHEPELAAGHAALLSATTHAERSRSFQRLFEAVMHRWLEGRFAPEGVESWPQFRARVLAGLERILAAAPARAAAFTSVGPIAVLLQRALGTDDAQSFRTAWRIRNASLTTFVFDGKGRVTLDGFNALPHLPDPSTWTFR